MSITVVEEVSIVNYFLFARCMGNTQVEDAEIILLTEQHNSELCRKINARVIESLYRPGDIVLVESTPIGQPVRGEDEPMTKQIKFSIEAAGWDHPDIELMIQKVNAIRQKNICIGMCSTPSRPSYFHYIRETFQERNRYLCKAILEHSRPGRRVFLIAGRAHIIWEKQNPWFKDPSFSTKLLTRLLSRFRFVIFDSKEFDFLPENMQEGWRFLPALSLSKTSVKMTSPGGDPDDPGGSSGYTMFEDEPKVVILRLKI